MGTLFEFTINSLVVTPILVFTDYIILLSNMHILNNMNLSFSNFVIISCYEIRNFFFFRMNMNY